MKILARLAVFSCLFAAVTSPGIIADEAHPDLSKQKTLYLIATGHLDTQWNWTIQESIQSYLPATLHSNFYLFQNFPDYIFNFEGAFRYMLAKEYYPQDYARLKGYVEGGQWRVAGSSIDAGDVNIPSPESLFRHVLYGNGFFKREFNKTSSDIFLPDCFGFGYALPSIASHAGLKGFSTQKLTWGSAYGIPFDLGVWEGPDGSSILAAPNGGSYRTGVDHDLSTDEGWIKRIQDLGDRCGVYARIQYFGTGDRGGAPGFSTVKNVGESSVSNGPVKVLNTSSDQIFKDITPEEQKKLPRYKGELVMTTHGTGCYTSQAYMKRWNRKNELLADSSERASVAADWLGGAAYPREKLRDSWIRFLWHQFHDDMTGTSTPQVYAFSWNDEVIAMNAFSEVLKDAAGATVRAFDTRVKGFPVVVYNPVSRDRRDVVEADVPFAKVPKAVRVYGPDGREVPSQLQGTDGNVARVVFLAGVPSVGYAVYDVRPADKPYAAASELKISGSTLENRYYKVTIDQNGDVSSVRDKSAKRELLSSPARLEILNGISNGYAAWEVQLPDIKGAPRAVVGGPAEIKVVENGPARVALEVTRRAEGSIFTQRIRLAAGDTGRRVDFDTTVDWKTKGSLLKAAFPLAAKNPNATYDLGLGTIDRPSNTDKLYEVPAQQWAAITDQGGKFGTAVLNDCKYGWDKPEDNTLRLSLLYTPASRKYPYQTVQDLGAHHFTYSLYGYSGSWKDSGVSDQAAELNQPLLAFGTRPHGGKLGRTFSLARLSTPNAIIKAIKKAEDTDEIVVRVQETSGKGTRSASLAMAAPIISAREVNAQEETIGRAGIQSGRIVLDLRPYQPRTFALKLAKAPVRLSPPAYKPVDLAFDADVISMDGEKRGGDFDGAGSSLSGELLPVTIKAEGISFKTGPKSPGQKNAVSCSGQKIRLQSGGFNRLYILAAASGADVDAVFTLDGKAVRLRVQNYTGKVGQWYNRVIDTYRLPDHERLLPGFVKTSPIAFVSTHLHDRDGQNEPYIFGYLYKLGMDIPRGAKVLTLPKDPRVKVLAISLANDENDSVVTLQPIIDRLIPAPVIKQITPIFLEQMKVEMAPGETGGNLHFTLDGSEPTASSPAYTGPVTIKDTATVRVRAFSNGLPAGAISEATFTRTELREPLSVSGLVSGLDYDYFEGAFKRLPDLSQLEIKGTGTSANFDAACAKKKQDLALRFKGYIDAPRDGIYTFYAKSPTEVQMKIGDAQLISTNFAHGGEQRDCGAIALKKGMHPVTLEYCSSELYSWIDLRWEGPGIPRQKVPDGVLYRQN